MDGDGLHTGGDNYNVAFPNAAAGMGCAATCVGYELTTNLDFDSNRSGFADEGDAYWNNGAGWEPISGDAYTGENSVGYNAVFEGNYHLIYNLFIHRQRMDLGLFGRVGANGAVRNVGLIDVSIFNDHTSLVYSIGSLAGILRGTAEKIYATGAVKTLLGHTVGGLIGEVTGSLYAS